MKMQSKASVSILAIVTKVSLRKLHHIRDHFVTFAMENAPSVQVAPSVSSYPKDKPFFFLSFPFSSFTAADEWNHWQQTFKLGSFIPLYSFRSSAQSMVQDHCACLSLWMLFNVVTLNHLFLYFLFLCILAVFVSASKVAWWPRVVNLHENWPSIDPPG